MNRCARCSGELSSLAVFCTYCAQVQEPDFEQLIGQTIEDRYHIYRRLGRGGLSTVFAATDLRSDQIATIKVSDPTQLVRRDLGYSINEPECRHYWAELLERMRREAEMLTGIDHPNIVRFYGTGAINDDLRYVAMEFLRGRTLREELDELGRIDVHDTTRLMVEAATALAEVHSRGIVHRDINPRNIFLCGNSIKLIDFGIAKFPQPEGAPPFTRHSLTSGTVAYASPEQCQGRSLDHRSDIYSLGIVTYEMLTGERPFQGRTPTEIALKQIQAEPTSPRALNDAISATLEQAILRALAKDPEERHQSITDFAEELLSRSNRIVIPLDGVMHRNVETAMEASEDAPSEEPKSGRHWRRATFASAGILSALIAAGLVWDYISSHNDGAITTNPLIASTSPSPDNTQGSDVDALELAAKLPQPSGGTVRMATPSAGHAPFQSLGQTKPHQEDTINKRASGLSVPASSKQSVHSHAPSQGSKATEPNVPSKDENQTPAAQDSSQKDRPADENSMTSNEDLKKKEEIPNRSRTVTRDPVTPPIEAERRSDRGPSSHRGNADNAGDDEEFENEERLGPKLIQWSGSVNGAREITIEMPGLPGRIEIPRVYRDRVGIIEPPSADNRWRCAIMRVFGRGHISFIMRWWPMAASRKFTARSR